MLVINNVDLNALEKQRLTLVTIPRSGLNAAQREALEGIQNMLDVWSDIRCGALNSDGSINP